jgi:hypothetical protein
MQSQEIPRYGGLQFAAAEIATEVCSSASRACVRARLMAGVCAPFFQKMKICESSDQARIS